VTDGSRMTREGNDAEHPEALVFPCAKSAVVCVPLIQRVAVGGGAGGERLGGVGGGSAGGSWGGGGCWMGDGGVLGVVGGGGWVGGPWLTCHL